jgi:serine/threonine protein kinase
MHLRGDYINLDRHPEDNLLEHEGKYYQIDWLNERGKYYAGGNGTVFKLTDEQEGLEYAIKILKYPNHLSQTPRLKKRIARFGREIEALLKAKSNQLSNIVEIEFYGNIEIGGNLYGYYVMQKCDRNLKEYLRDVSLSFGQKTLLCQKILLGIMGLHEYKIYHRDIKHENIFFIGNEPLIGDLGLVDYQDSDIDINEEGDLIGPTGWFSPEALNKSLCEGENNTNPHGHDCVIDAKSEVFQMGKLFWYIYQGNIPVGQIEGVNFVHNNDLIFGLLFSMLQYAKPRRCDTDVVLDQLDQFLAVN